MLRFMSKVSKAAIATALFFIFCALVHLPYFFLTRLHVIESCRAMSTTISILGTLICVVEVVFFAYVLMHGGLNRAAKGAVWSIMVVPAFSAFERTGNIIAGACQGAFAEWWAAQGAWVGGVSSFFGIFAVVALIWLGICLRRERCAMVMSFVVAYEALLTFVLWTLLAPTVTISQGLYSAVLVQYYILWPLFYFALARYFRGAEK